MHRELQPLPALLLFQPSPFGGAIGHAARSDANGCSSCEPKPFCSPFPPHKRSLPHQGTPPPLRLAPPEQSVPIGGSRGRNVSPAMPVLPPPHLLRSPSTGFLRRSFSLLPSLSNKSPDSFFSPYLVSELLLSTSSVVSISVSLPPHRLIRSPSPPYESARVSHVARLVAPHCVSRGRGLTW